MVSVHLPGPVDAVLFDMDGLLLDTERIYSRALISAARAVDFEMSEIFCHSMIGIPGTECDAMIQRHFGPSFPLAAYLKAYSSQLDVLLKDGVPLKPGAKELIDHCAMRGTPKALATSSRRPTVESRLSQVELLDRFDAIVTRDEVERGKPSPDVFIKAASELGVDPSRCLVLEDSLNGIRAAHAAGTMPVMVPDIVGPTDEIRSMCIAIVDSLHEIPGLIPIRR